jgi:hypothetical protein
VTIKEQIDCAARELDLRCSEYPKQIRKRKMSKAEASYEIRAMAAILETLKNLEKPGIMLDDDLGIVNWTHPRDKDIFSRPE